MNKSILMVLTSHDRNGPTEDDRATSGGFYLAEVSHPYFVFQAAGYSIDFVSPKGGRTHVDGLDLSDTRNAAFWGDALLRSATENTLSPVTITPSDYSAIFYAGGHATMWDFPDCAELAKIAAQIYERGGVVAAVCHGPAGLLNVRLHNGRYLVEGKRVAAFTDDEELALQMYDKVPFLLAGALVSRGATHCPVSNFNEQVIISDRVVTGQNPASASGVADAVVALLNESRRTGN